MAVGSVTHDSAAYGVNSPKKTAKTEAPATGAEKQTSGTDSAEISDVAKDLAGGSELAKVDTSQNAEQKKLGSAQAKKDEGARLDVYLAGLRRKYGEKEAMSRFTDYMRSEGYEIFENVADPVKPDPGTTFIGADTSERYYGLLKNGSYKNFGRHLTLADIGMAVGGSDGISTGHHTIVSANNHSSLKIQSAVTGTVQDGHIGYDGVSWAVYDAGYDTASFVEFEIWKNRSSDLNEQAGFDVKEYVDTFTAEKRVWGKAFAAESTSTELADMLTSVLNQSGIQLSAGENMTIDLRQSDHGDVTGLDVGLNFDDDALRTQIQDAIDSAFAADPALGKAFKDEHDSVPTVDLSHLEYYDGVQSKRFTQRRQFLFSGNNPSAVVMGSGLDSIQHGYIYMKKLSDSVDLNADVVTIKSRTSDYGKADEQAARANQLAEELRRAMLA